MRLPGAADPVRRRRDRRPPPAVRDHRRARHQLRHLHADRDLAAATAAPAAGLPPQPLDRAPVPRRGQPDLPAGRRVDRAAAGAPQPASPDSDLGGGFLLGASLGLVFVPCGGPIIGAISANAARVHLGWQTVAITVAYALGAALPMLAIAALGQRATRRIRANAQALRTGLGVVLALAALALVFNADTKLQTWFPRLHARAARGRAQLGRTRRAREAPAPRAFALQGPDGRGQAPRLRRRARLRGHLGRGSTRSR